jgi:fatty acid hydroxylase family protein
MAAAAAPPEPVRRFRAEYREREISPRYRGSLHALFTFGGGGLALIACFAQLEAVRPLEWLTLPLALVYANLSEYVGHRYPMHRPFAGLGLIYKRHAGQHHRFFTHEAMPIESRRDFRAVLFPPILVFFFFGLFAAPVWFALAWAISSNVAWLFVAGGLAYYLNYEVLHLAYHLPPEHPLARIGLVRRLRWLHQSHHDPSLMTRANFNITYPLGDWLFGTLRRGGP